MLEKGGNVYQLPDIRSFIMEFIGFQQTFATLLSILNQYYYHFYR